MRDTEIVDLYWERNESAIDQTRMRYEGYCDEISWRILENREDVQECLNDTWLQTWNSIPSNRPLSLKSYVGRITRNLSLNRFKKETRKKRGGNETEAVYEELAEFLGQEDTVARNLEKRQFLDFLTDYLNSVSKRDREIFVLRFWYLETPKEIANTFGVSEKEIYNRLYLLRRRFQEKWKKEDMPPVC